MDREDNSSLIIYYATSNMMLRFLVLCAFLLLLSLAAIETKNFNNKRELEDKDFSEVKVNKNQPSSHMSETNVTNAEKRSYGAI